MNRMCDYNGRDECCKLCCKPGNTAHDLGWSERDDGWVCRECCFNPKKRNPAFWLLDMQQRLERAIVRKTGQFRTAAQLAQWSADLGFLWRVVMATKLAR